MSFTLTVLPIAAALAITIPALIMSRPPKAAFARKNRGFTLIELMIVLAIIGIIAAIIVPAMTSSSRGSGEEASVAAKTYYTSLYPEYSDFRVVCAGSDSDGDGYVSCSGRGMKSGTETWANLPPIQCAGGGMAAWQRQTSGCKQQGVLIQQQ